MKKNKLKDENKYDLSQKELLKLVKTKGILVETMKKSMNIPPVHDEYKEFLGIVTIKKLFGETTNIYDVYEDFDGSIKYYDYPFFSRKELNAKRKKFQNIIYNMESLPTPEMIEEVAKSFDITLYNDNKETNNCAAMYMEKNGEAHLKDEKDREKLNRILTMDGTNSGKCRKKIDKDYCKILLHQLDTCTSNPSNEHYVIIKGDIYIFKEALT